MKLLHLSDLHIGKRVNEFSMLEDQRYILKQILEIVEREQVQGVLLAGDIYDKPVPPGEAVQVFDQFLTELAGRKLPVFIISGNHDSPERLAFGAKLFCSRGIYLASVYEGNTPRISLEDSYGQVVIHLLPFLKPAYVRHAFPEEEIPSYQAALETALKHMEMDSTKRNVLVAHQFVTGASTCQSEELMVGGVDQIDVTLFQDFDYVALGHLHSPQKVGRETVRYCGTPLKYSFSETEQKKSVTIVELKEKGNVSVRTIPLKPLHDMRKIKGTYLEVTAKSFYEGTDQEDYLQVTLTDEEDVPDGMSKLRIFYPNLMSLEYDNRRTRENRSIEGAKAVEEKSELELFQEFYQMQNNQPMSQQQKAYVKGLLEEIQEKGVGC